MPSEQIVESVEELKNRQVLGLFDLSAEESQELKKRIEEHKGLIRVFVHPASGYREPVPNIDRVYQILARTLVNKNSPPIIILEDEKCRPKFSEQLGHGDYKIPNDVYSVETIHNYPYPKFDDMEDPGRNEWGRLGDGSSKFIAESMARLAIYLEDLGVKEILVGGTKLEIMDGEIERCVGNFIRIMKDSSMKIKLSSATAPDGREEVRKIDPHLI